MKILFLFFLLLCQAAVSQSARAQCLSLADLLAIGADPTALTTPQAVTPHLSFEWAYTGPTAASRDGYWTLPAREGGAVPAARLMVRAQRPGQDVVLKTTDASCVRQLRSELKSKKLEVQPLTCPNCEAVRFKGPEFEATVYSQMKGEFPFVVVVHQVPPVVPGSAAKASGSKTE